VPGVADELAWACAVEAVPAARNNAASKIGVR
jgi:hypothetical protein